jgi:hypothetical protein
MSDKTLPGNNPEGTINDPDDISAMAGYLLMSNLFDTRGIVVASTHRSELRTVPDQGEWANQFFGSAIQSDFPNLNSHLGGFDSQISFVESSIKSTAEKFSSQKNYADLSNYRTVKMLLDHLKQNQDTLFVLCWGSLTEPAIFVKHAITTGQTNLLARVKFIAHWTNSSLHQGTPQEPEKVANCNEDATACAYMKTQALNGQIKYYELGAIGQHGIVSGAPSGSTYYNQFKKSALGEIFAEGKFAYNRVDHSDAATYWTLLGNWGVSLSDVASNGTNLPTTETANENKFKNKSPDIHAELLRRSNLASSQVSSSSTQASSSSSSSNTSPSASLWVYPGASPSYASTKYQVRLKSVGQANFQNSFVYQDSNKNVAQKGSMTDWNHWSTFSFSGSVEVEITRVGSSSFGSGKIHPLPLAKNLQIHGNKATFTLDKPAKLWIDIQGLEEHPLFLFADPPEINPPSGATSNLVYFGPGVHNIGKHYRLEAGKTYYFAGGAYVTGSLLGDNNASNITIKGRGILSGENIPHCGYNQCQFDRAAIRFQGSSGSNLNLEGITIINPGQYCIQAYGARLNTKNIKAMGWWYETDGWIAGNDSRLEDSFFKVYDDVVKLYFQRQIIKNLVVYKQHNGAVFQFGWSSEKGADAIVDSIYVVEDETNWNQTGLEGNRAFINTANGNTQNSTLNMQFSNVWFDGNISYLLGIKTQGLVDGITIKDMRVEGTQRFKSYLAGGNIKGVVLNNVSINNSCVTKNNDISLQTSGTIAPISYSCQLMPSSSSSNLSSSVMSSSSTVPPVSSSSVVIQNIADLQGELKSDGDVQLNWSLIQGATGYRVRRKLPADATYVNIGDVGATVTEYTDSSVLPNTTYQYMVRPLVQNTAVASSNVVSVATLEEGPVGITNQSNSRLLDPVIRNNSFPESFDLLGRKTRFD